jgi:hypothetical protein
MNVRFESSLPWEVAFSFARAIQQPALEIWRGQDANVRAAQHALNHRAKCNRAARRAEYNAGMEMPPADTPQPKIFAAEMSIHVPVGLSQMEHRGYGAE